jgi:CDP-paratose 2-epimerase
MSETILITGGAGFVGSNLAILLKKKYQDYSVIALDNLRRRGSELNIQRLKEHEIEFVHGDIRCREDISFDDRDISLIIDCSAEPSVLAGYNSSSEYVIKTNFFGTVNCLELAKDKNANFIYLSTSRVYPFKSLNKISFKEEETRFAIDDAQDISGVTCDGISEAFPLDGTRSLYGATKLSSELIIQEYVEMYDIKAVINRCGVIAGPWQMGKVDQGVFSFWMLHHYFKRDLNYIGFGGEGKQVRDLMHINDLFNLVDLEIHNMSVCNGATYNVGGGNNCCLSLLDTTCLCEKLTGNEIDIGSIENDREMDVRIYISDNSKVQRDMGWVVQKTPHDILYDIYVWICEHEGLVEKAIL